MRSRLDEFLEPLAGWKKSSCAAEWSDNDLRGGSRGTPGGHRGRDYSEQQRANLNILKAIAPSARRRPVFAHCGPTARKRLRPSCRCTICSLMVTSQLRIMKFTLLPRSPAPGPIGQSDSLFASSSAAVLVD
jgi:hypothetical protein